MSFEKIRRRVQWHTGMMFSLRPYLRLLEIFYLQKAKKTNKPQLFILGLPRSGTTLVYQYIVHRMNIAYITNQAGYYYLSPLIVTNLQRNQLGTYQSDFKSNYGKVSGPLSPREAGAFWGRFFGTEDYVSIDDLTIKRIQTLQNTIFGIQQLFGDLPFVNKNVKHMLRIQVLSEIFPNAYFLVVERDLPQVALSVLRGRYNNLADPMQWWSVKPPNYAELKDLPVVEQVSGQLLALQDRMTADFSQIDTERIIRFSYLNFCDRPESIITLLTGLLGEVSCRNMVVSHFESSIKSPQNNEEFQLIELIEQYESSR